MQSDTMLDSRMYVRLDLGFAPEANRRFQDNRANQGHLANQLLLYDRVVIPTKDFGIVPVLIAWLGAERFRECLREGTFGFARPMSLLGYAGNGGGINAFTINSTKEKPFEWWQEAIFGAVESAVELQLKNQWTSISSKEKSELFDLILGCTKSIAWDNDIFMKRIVHESYTDIKNDRFLSDFVLSKERSRDKPVDLRQLSGVNPNQFRISGLTAIRDGVDVVLRVAEINMEILLAHLYQECDIGTSEGAEILLQGKLLRCGIQPSVAKKFLSLVELRGVPDIRRGVESGSVTLCDILALRKKKVSREFRQWLRSCDAKDGRELERIYVSALESSGKYSSLPARVLRFIVTTAAGVLHPIAGPLMNAIDSFFVEKWLAGYSPKLFLNEVARLPTKNGR
jgi:hypothetical protein